MTTEQILALSPAQFKRLRADYRLLIRRFYMDSGSALSLAHARIEVSRGLRQGSIDARRQQTRDTWQHSVTGTVYER